MPFHLSNPNKLKLTFRRKPMFISLSVHDHHDIHVISAHDLEERMYFIINNQLYCYLDKL